ncbi:MAG: N-6 DNA methylase, partial [Bacteroidia bacterium]
MKSKINWLWDRFWAGGLSNPITAIEQISYLLFMRRLEYVEGGKLFNKANSQLKWSYYTVELEPEKMLAHIKNKVFPFIKTKLNAPHEPFSLSMKNAVFLIDKASLLKDAVDTINEIYDEIEKQQKKGQHFQDTQGDLYEYLLDATNQAGKNGQFRTPRHIIQMMCEIINPNVNDKICDLTSGTAGFLVGAYQH